MTMCKKNCFLFFFFFFFLRNKDDGYALWRHVDILLVFPSRYNVINLMFTFFCRVSCNVTKKLVCWKSKQPAEHHTYVWWHTNTEMNIKGSNYNTLGKNKYKKYQQKSGESARVTMRTSLLTLRLVLVWY